MQLLSSTNRVLLLLAVLSGGQHLVGAQNPAPAAANGQATPPVKGKVLFERHDPAVTDTPAEPASVAPPETGDAQGKAATGNRGLSSSRHPSRTTLRRRDTPAAATEGDPVPAADDVVRTSTAAEVSSSSDSADGGSANEPIVLTAADKEATQHLSANERTSVAVAASDLDVHLHTHTGAVEVRAQLVVRNTGTEPLRQVPLRISGALQWQSVRIAGLTTLPVQQHRIADDLDHTGYATELAAELPQPLAAGQAVSLDLYYGGLLASSTQRLTALGAPAGRAALTDWDTVTDTFTGLRGLGNVLWYPVAGAPALLRDGSAVPAAVENSRMRDLRSRFHLRLTLEYSGSQPDAAFFCGERQPLVPLAADTPASNEGGFVTAEWTRETLGPHTPSLFVAGGAPQLAANGLLRVVTDRADTVAAAGEAAARVRTMLSEWLGTVPGRPLDVLDLPVSGATGFADGSLLVAPLTTSPSAVLAPSLVQPLASAWLPADITAPWLRDGIPAFLQAVWAERTSGRAGALAMLGDSFHTVRAQANVAEKGGVSSSLNVEGAPESPACGDPLCTRIRAAYIFEMLRAMLGDAQLQQAISGWAVQETPGRSSMEQTADMKRLLQQVAGKRDLTWFFSNWIDRDRGLPELTIVTVAPRRVERSSPVNYLPQARRPFAGPVGAEPVAPTDARDMSERDAAALAAANGGGTGPAAGSWLVAVEVQNNGSAEAEVPVTVRSGGLTNTLPLHVPAHGRATIRVPFEADPQEVLVNDGSVPEVRTTTHRRSIGNLPAAP